MIPCQFLCAFSVVAVFLTGCDCVRPSIKRDPIDVHVAPECRTRCQVNLSLITSDPNSLIEAAKDAVTKCDARRALCESALIRAQEAGAIK